MKKIPLLISILSCIIIYSCSSKPEKLFRVQEDGLFGFIDSIGNIKINPQYKYVGNFSEDGYALIITDVKILNRHINLTYGFIDTKNNLVVDTINKLIINSHDCPRLWHENDSEDFFWHYIYKNIGFNEFYFENIRLSENKYPYMNESTKKFGYKNIKGDTIIPAKFLSANPFYKGVAIVSEYPDSSGNTNDISLINQKGDYIKERGWSYVHDFTKKDLTWSLEFDIDIDADGKMSDNGGIWTLIDLNGNIVIGPINPLKIASDSYTGWVFNGYPDNDNLYLYSFPKLYGVHLGYSYINKDGKYATDYNNDNSITFFGDENTKGEVFGDATNFSEGFAGVKGHIGDEAFWTFMNPDLEIVTEEKYDSVKTFHENMAVVKQHGEWGVINKDFEIIIPFKFSEISNFQNGLAYAKISGTKYDREGYINSTGEFIWETKRKKWKSQQSTHNN